MRIVFMGTPDFAVVALRALHESEHEVVAVVTQPDQPKGRGYVLTPSPVKAYAQEVGLPVFTPERVKDDAFLSQMHAWSADVAVVAAYGKILPQAVLDAPKYGALNIHSSILPKYRGAAPIQRALMAGEETVGVTIMQMDAGLDTGDMLKVKTTLVTDSDDLERVHDRLAELGAQAMAEVLDELAVGKTQPKKQDHAQMTYAAKIEKADCLLDFTRSATELFWQVRALSPAPLAFTYHNGEIFKVVQARVVDADQRSADPGTVVSLEDGQITVACGSGLLAFIRVLPQGKGRMSASDYIRGRKIACGDRLGASK